MMILVERYLLTAVLFFSVNFIVSQTTSEITSVFSTPSEHHKDVDPILLRNFQRKFTLRWNLSIVFADESHVTIFGQSDG